MAFAFKENGLLLNNVYRPVTVFLKPMSYFALLRIKHDEDKCFNCGLCKRVCPMEVDITDNSGNGRMERSVFSVRSV